MSIAIEPVSFGPEAAALLTQCGLPVSDIGADSPATFFGCRRRDRLVGVVGLEVYGEVGLLRSLAVLGSERRSGVGRDLVARAERHAEAAGVKRLYLLTTSAAGFFEHLGYAVLPRSEAPPAVAATAQFSGLCPMSSSFMFKAVPGVSASGGAGSGATPAEPARRA